MTLRTQALRLFQVAVAAADPALALRQAFQAHPPPLPPGGRYIVIAFGKAAAPMAETALANLGGALVDALVVTTYDAARPVAGATVIAAGHPVPDANGERAGQVVMERLQAAGPDDRVIALISGGGSALLPAPAGALTLADKVAVNRLLLTFGLSITEMNLVRQQLSQLKGGGIARLAAPAPVTGYILSDVIGDDLRTIASGPTAAPLGSRAQAVGLLQTQGLWQALPPRVRAHLTAPEGPRPPMPEAVNHLIGSNRTSLLAAAAAYGPGATIVENRLVGDVQDAAAKIVGSAARAPQPSACLIFGGETTVKVTGNGLGGRNQELALRVARAMPPLRRDWVFLSAGTDGRDGPTPAAGGLVDAETIPRIRQAGGDPDRLLAENDSYRALTLADALVLTGPTGTNVADVQILLLGPGPATS